MSDTTTDGSGDGDLPPPPPPNEGAPGDSTSDDPLLPPNL